MLGSERDRIFNDWLARHKGIDPLMINPWATKASRAKNARIFMLSLVLMAAIGFTSSRVNMVHCSSNLAMTHHQFL